MRRAAAALLVLAVLDLAGIARAQDPQVNVTVDNPRPAADDVVRLTYVFSGPGVGGALKAPSLPLRNLTIAGGPSTSDEVSFINGVFKRSMSLTYYLRPSGPGPAEIGETTWMIGEKTAKAPSYLLEVGPARGRRSVASEPGEDDPISTIRGRVPRVSTFQREGRREPLVEYRATPDKTTAYVGEEIVVHYELLTQADVQGLEYVDPPKFPGCWAEDLEKPDKPVGRRDVVDGQSVIRFTLLKKLVSGLNPGAVTIPSARIRVSVRAAADPFSDPFAFLWRPQVLELSTKPIALRMLPIPGERSFKGPVGRFDVTAKLDRSRVAVGDAVTLRVKISGTGNLRTASEAPQITIADVRLYPPTVKSDLSHAGKPGTALEWDYVMVPQRAGDISIPPVAVEVFDPKERRVVTKTSGPLTLLAEGATAPSGPATATAAPPTSDVAAADTAARTELPRAPATGVTAASASSSADASGPSIDLTRRTVTLPFWALAALPGLLLLAGGTVLVVRRRRVREELREALAPEPGETKERVAGRIDRALRAWLARRHEIPEGTPSPAALERLEANGMPADQLRDLRTLFSELEFLRFAPQLGDYEVKIREVRALAARILPRLR